MTDHFPSIDAVASPPPLPDTIPVYVDGKEYLADVRDAMNHGRVRLTWLEADGTKQSVTRPRHEVEWAEIRKLAVAV